MEIRNPANFNPINPSPQTSPQINPLILGGLVGASLTALVASVYFFILRPNNSSSLQLPSPTSAPPSVSPTPSLPPTSGKYGDISWISPTKVTNPSFLRKYDPQTESGYHFDDLGTYKVAQFSSGAELLLAYILPEGPSHSLPVYLLKEGQQLHLIDTLLDENLKQYLIPMLDTSQVDLIALYLKELLPPEYLTVTQPNNNNYGLRRASTTFGSLRFFSQLKNPQKIASLPQGDIYATYTPYTDQPDVHTRKIYLKLADSTIVSYLVTGTIINSDDKVPYFILTSGVKNNTGYVPGIPSGCGFEDGITVIKNSNPSLSEKTVIGETAQGRQDVFQLKNPNNPILRFIYDSYKIGRDYPSAPPVLSPEQFASQPNHFLFQDYLGDWQLYINNEYGRMVECGKPVIYLYPQKQTQINVQVGADITKSEPLYPPSGWTVVANPSGKLTYQSREYFNLFWEGTGWGEYANRSNEGIIVPQSKLILTLKSQLTQLGLNSQESADFLEFWQPKLPTAPYVRLTWLNTADMDQLAPLSVRPAPDTKIRIFLEFEGLSQPKALIPQKLSAPVRKGFTLVEWGGLLVKN